MAKRKPEEPPAGSPPWMATFSDLMNLLLCFFVLLFSMSTVDEQKYNELVASMSSAFSILSGGATAIGDGILIGSGVSQLNQLDQYINSTGRTADDDTESEEFNEHNSEGTSDDQKFEQMQQELQEHNLQENEALAERIAEAISESNMNEEIEVSFGAEYVLLNLKGALLFDSGKAYLRTESYPVLDKVGVILERYANSTIEIEGHTDTVPMSGTKYENNDELSSGRALAVFNYLIERTTLDPATIKHSGRGEWIPVADNATEAGRAKNRRVEIKIFNPPMN